MPPPASSDASPERSTPNSSTTPTMPTPMPASPQPWERSDWSKPSASRAVKIGTLEMRIAVSDEEMWFSP